MIDLNLPIFLLLFSSKKSLKNKMFAKKRKTLIELLVVLSNVLVFFSRPFIATFNIIKRRQDL